MNEAGNIDIIESNNEIFKYCSYNEINIIQRNKDKYVNATKLCLQFNRVFRKIYDNKSWKDFYEEFQKTISRPRKDGFIYEIKTGYKFELHGTYIHPKLINFVAFWASSKYAFKVSYIMDIINEELYIKNITLDRKINEMEENLKDLTTPRNRLKFPAKICLFNTELENKFRVVCYKSDLYVKHQNLHTFFDITNGDDVISILRKLIKKYINIGNIYKYDRYWNISNIEEFKNIIYDIKYNEFSFEKYDVNICKCLEDRRNYLLERRKIMPYLTKQINGYLYEIDALPILKERLKLKEIYHFLYTPESVKNQLNLSDKDNGIDAIGIDNSNNFIIFQMKHYEKSYIKSSSLKSFINICESSPENLKYFLVFPSSGKIEKYDENILKSLNVEYINIDIVDLQCFDFEDEWFINLCQEFYNLYKRLPKKTEKFNNWNIGYFFQRIRIDDAHKHLIPKLNEIFQCDVSNITFKDTELETLKNNMIKSCKEYYELYNHMPKVDEKFNNFNIGDFIRKIKTKPDDNRELVEELNEIFHCNILKNTYQKQTKNIITEKDNEKLQLCRDFYNEFHRIPADKENYKNKSIGSFIYFIRRGHNNHLLNEINNIFQCDILNNTYESQLRDQVVNRNILLCQEFYKEFHRLPLGSDGKYKDVNLSGFIATVRKNPNKNKDIINKLNEIFQCDINIEKSLKIQTEKRVNYKIQLCKEFYEKFHRLPTSSEKYQNINIGTFVYCHIKGKYKFQRDQVLEIFKDVIDTFCGAKMPAKLTKIIVSEPQIELQTDIDILDICKKYYEEFNHIPPDKTMYYGKNIGSFISGVRGGRNKELVEKLNDIFQCDILTTTYYEQSKIINIQKKLESCKKFYNEFHRLPNHREKYNGFGISEFVKNILKGKNNCEYKQDIDKIFNL